MPAREASREERHYMETLAALARALRRDSGRGVKETAGLLGVTLSSYKRWERGEYLPSGLDLQRIGRLYGLDANLLVYGVSFLGEPLSSEAKTARLLQRLLWRLRALDLQSQAAVGEFVRDLYEIQLKSGGISAEDAAEKAQRQLAELLGEG
ncbi:helix-turn-helix domain-containing protein (plasmid) [Microbulbifer sp. CnH-101-E]|uniref:helix-turn-helix domain-containing protein n=1 Tax=unclassified Microbulbifer TaxID=2619833 RepID=UPI004039BE21